MPCAKLVFVGATLVAVIALSAVPALPLPQAAPGPGRTPRSHSPRRSALRPDAIAVRLLLGVGDTEPQAWDGKVTIDQGEIVALEGGGFRGGDALTGPDSWKARSTAAPRRPRGPRR